MNPLTQIKKSESMKNERDRENTAYNEIQLSN